MPKSTVLLTTLLVFVVSSSYSQRINVWGDPHVQTKFATLAAKEPAYATFTNEMNALIKKADGSNSNEAAAKALLLKYKLLLGNLYTRANIMAPIPKGTANRSSKIVSLKTARTSSLLKNMAVLLSLSKTELAPYKKTWQWTNQAGAYIYRPDTTLSDFAAGKIAMKYAEGPLTPGNKALRFGLYMTGYGQSFVVPSDPAIIAAEIKFEYSFSYTGWDTYGAVTGIDLAVATNNQLSGTAINELYEYEENAGYNNTGMQYRKAAVLMAPDTLTSDFGEYHAQENNGSFILSGYVTPGATIDLKLGLGHINGAHGGLNGFYNYTEFRLKKITVRYFK